MVHISFLKYIFLKSFIIIAKQKPRPLNNSLLPDKQYPSKILLVGEYGLLYGGEALSIPNQNLGGRWAFGQNNFPGLKNFCDYLSANDHLGNFLNLDQFRKDIHDGLYFDSNIPQAYGLGSSGCLCAGVADRYGENIDTDPLPLRQFFIHMESYFHGSSSGLDPLVSYLNKPLHLKDVEALEVLEKNIVLDNEGYKIFLLDSGIQRNTKEWVHLFKSLMQDKEYYQGYCEKMLPANKSLIESLIRNNPDLIINNWLEVSEWSLEYFYQFIPDTLKLNWKNGIKNKSVLYKLCGAGGGGFFLCLEIKK